MKMIAFVTRVHPKRANMLKKCIESIKVQTSDDYVHIISRDDKSDRGYGIPLANQSLVKIKSIDARYVMILDDDDMLVDPNFVEIFKEAINDNYPEIVFFKSIIKDEGIYPRQEIWGKSPVIALIASFCFAVRLDVWKKYIHKWGVKSAGDYYFISECYRNTKTHVWLDHVVAKTQKKAGRGRGEREHV